MASEGLLRIGELSRRTGVTPDLLRAWERRYGLLAPQRTSGGFRLYPLTDVGRIEAMQSYLARGLSAAEAARLAKAQDEPGRVGTSISGLLGDFRAALDAYDEPHAQLLLDRMLRRSRLRPSCVTRCCRTCTSSATVGSAARPPLRRSTSRAA